MNTIRVRVSEKKIMRNDLNKMPWNICTSITWTLISIDCRANAFHFTLRNFFYRNEIISRFFWFTFLFAFERCFTITHCDSPKQIKIYLSNQIKPKKRTLNENEIWGVLVIYVELDNSSERNAHQEPQGNELTKWKSIKCQTEKMETNIMRKKWFKTKMTANFCWIPNAVTCL